MAVGPQESVLAPRFSRVLGVLIVAICVFTEVSLVLYGHLDALLRATPALAFVAFGTYTLFWAPLLRIDPAEIEVVNPLRTHRIAWPAIQNITTRWTLTFMTDRGSFSAWAAPAQSPWDSIGRLNRDALGRPSLGAEATVRRRGSAAGLAPIVLHQWESYRDTKSAGAHHVSTRWHVATIVVLACLATLTIVGLAWP
jgi:hypothetical protein